MRWIYAKRNCIATSLYNSLKFVDSVGRTDPTLDLLISIERGGGGHISVSAVLDAIQEQCGSGLIDLSKRRKRIGKDVIKHIV